MVIYIAADHKGFQLKEEIRVYLKEGGYEVEDLHPAFDENDDYPDVARSVAEKVQSNLDQSRGILVCGSGAGVDIVANKFPLVRSVLGSNPDQVFDARHDDSVNVLSLAASFTSPEEAKKMVKVFLETRFEEGEERFRRRLEKIFHIERENKAKDMY